MAPVRRARRRTGRKPTLFFAHRFADEEYSNGLIKLLQQGGFHVVSVREITNTSEAIIRRIPMSDPAQPFSTARSAMAARSSATRSRTLAAFRKRLAL
jgi:hypothetical protein